MHNAFIVNFCLLLWQIIFLNTLRIDTTVQRRMSGVTLILLIAPVQLEEPPTAPADIIPEP